jgi:hypothetical protein
MAKTRATSSRLCGCSMAKTRCALSWPWTSLTRMPGGGPPAFPGGAAFFGACARETAGAAAAIPAAFRNVRRFRVFSSGG